MNIEELRIGNLISFKGMWDGEVESITQGTIDIKGNGGIFPHDVFEAIPLTDEHFTKFGFAKDGNHFRKMAFNDVDKLEILITFLDVRKWFTNEHLYYNYDNGIVKLEYVHQLQNLWFALTSQELKYIQI